jgi:hypothetical protein
MDSKNIMHDFSKEIYGYHYYEIIERFSMIYRERFGMHKYEEIVNRIQTSKTFSKLNEDSRLKRTWLNDVSITGQMLLIPYFLFKGGYTQFLACLLALERWNQEVNAHTQVQDERELADISISIFNYISRARGFKI